MHFDQLLDKEDPLDLLILTIVIDSHRVDHINIKENDDPLQLAQLFCRKHRLPLKAETPIAQQIQYQLTLIHPKEVISDILKYTPSVIYSEKKQNLFTPHTTNAPSSSKFSSTRNTPNAAPQCINRRQSQKPHCSEVPVQAYLNMKCRKLRQKHQHEKKDRKGLPEEISIRNTMKQPRSADRLTDIYQNSKQRTEVLVKQSSDM